MNIKFKRKDKTMYIAESLYTRYIVNPLLPLIGSTFITPNMVTICNIFVSVYTFYLAYNNRFLPVAFLIQLYLFLDILDGNLARYKSMQSKLGKILDQISDKAFYTGIFIFIGVNVVDFKLYIILPILINLYGIIATFYIAPRIRKLKIVKRFGIKKFFMDRKYILGMDLGNIDFAATIFLLLNKLEPMYYFIISALIFDLIYRIVELKYNEKLSENIL